MTKHLLPWIVALGLTLAILTPLLKGQVPFPGGLLLGRFFPWNTQSWDGYPLGVPYKEFIAADTVRQTYPWRELAISEFKAGRMPWWNSYQASGTPLLANWQTAALYPLNLIYAVLPFSSGWVLQVVLQPILMMVGVFLWLSSRKLPASSRWLAGLAAAFAGYQVVWLELNTVGHAAVWLPWGLWAIDRTREKRRDFSWALAGFVLMSLLAGHLQTSLMVLVVLTLYLGWRHRQSTWRSRILAFMALVLPILVISPLLAMTWELTSLSPRAGQDAAIVKQFMVPWSRLFTLISPNLFGNPATETLWVREYGEFQMYFGLVPLVLALLGMRSKQTRWLTLVFFGSLALALTNPLAWLPYLLKLPVFESSAPSRWLFITQWSGAMLAGFGLSALLEKKGKRWLVIASATTLIMAGVVFAMSRFATDPVWQARWWSGFKNTMIPVGSLGMVAVFSIFGRRRLLIGAVMVATIAELQFFTLRYLPMSPMTHIFPESPPFEALQTLLPARVWGDYTASMTSNTWIPSRVLGVEGYDGLQIASYAELLAEGHTPALSTIPRSDSNLPSNQDTPRKQRLLDLLGVGYLLEKSDESTVFDRSKVYSPELSLVWSDSHFAIFSNPTAQPLWWTVPFHEVIASESGRLERVFDPSWDPNQTVILETHPNYSVPHHFVTPLRDQQEIPAPANLTWNFDSATRIQFEVVSETPVWLVGSQTWFPGWRAQVDGAPAEVVKVNYTFQGVLVPAGTHSVELRYFPSPLPDFSSTW